MSESFANLFPNFGEILGALALLVVLSMLLERALVLLFDWRHFKARLDGLGLKSPIAFLASLVVCARYKFDVMAVLFPDGSGYSALGILITAAIAAGGSAGAITLFQGVLRFSKEAQDAMRQVREAEARARKLEAEARETEAQATLAEVESRKKVLEAENGAALAEASARQARAEAERRIATSETEARIGEIEAEARATIAETEARRRLTEAETQLKVARLAAGQGPQG